MSAQRSPYCSAHAIFSNGLAITVGVILQGVVYSVWQNFSFVPGFALYDGSVVFGTPVSHFGWWTTVQFWVIIAGAVAPYFGLHLPRSANKLQYPVMATQQYLIFYGIFLAIGIAVDLANVGVSLNEIAQCSSSLCVNQWGFLLAFIIMIGCRIVFVDAYLVFCVWCYYWNLGYVNKYWPNMFNLEPPPPPPKTMEPDDEPFMQTAPEAPPAAADNEWSAQQPPQAADDDWSAQPPAAAPSPSSDDLVVPSAPSATVGAKARMARTDALLYEAATAPRPNGKKHK